MATKSTAPSEMELKTILGSTAAVWSGITQALETRFAPLDATWKPSKTDFGRMCLLQHKKRTLLYLTPGKNQVTAAIVLGDRAYHLAMESADSAVPAAIKKLLAEAKPYAEGRGIRFTVTSLKDVPVVVKLVEIKTTPK